MRSVVWSVVLLLSLTGCEWINNFSDSKAENPVMDAPPPRVAHAGDWQATRDSSTAYETNPQRDHIQLVSQNGQSPDDVLATAKAVATVDGRPILASEILDRYAARFREIRGKATADELRDIRKKLIKRDLKIHVERKLLVNAMQRSLSKEAREQLGKLIGETFDKEVQKMKIDMKVDSKVELEQKLLAEGTSLANLRDTFANQQMATYYFQSKVKSTKVIGRREMLQYYESHLKDYAIPAKARWQEIQLSFDKHGGKDGASKLTDRIIAELRKGTEFATLAKEHSDGITADKGGLWDWTQSGSLTDEKLDRALFNLPVDRIQVHEGKESLRLIRVVRRQKAGWKPFDKLQREIRTALKQEEKQRHARKMLDELMKNAIITTIFDGEPDFKPDWRKR